MTRHDCDTLLSILCKQSSAILDTGSFCQNPLYVSKAKQWRHLGVRDCKPL